MGYIFNDAQTIRNIITNITISVPGSRAFDAGTRISTITFFCAVAEVINVGITPGGNEVIDAAEVNAGVTKNVFIDRTFDTAFILYFTGITAATTIKIYG